MDNKSKEIHNQNSKCYRHKTLEFDSGLFDSCIDMTYVLTMENSDRIQHFTKQLELHKPSSKVIVQYNSGFRNCSKTLKEQTAPYDITDSLRNIFVNALENGYERVLVFEDDFFMDKDKYTQKDIDSICKYVTKHNPDVYTLGTLIHVSLPISKHPRILFTGHAHAVIYNRKYMKSFITNAARFKIEHCDQFWHKITFKKAGYHKPICYQLFPDTENSKQWGPAAKFNHKWLKLWKLDKSHEHYQAHTHFFSALHWIVLVGIIVGIVFIVRSIVRKRRYSPPINF